MDSKEFNAWLLEALANWARDVGGDPTSIDVDAMVTAIEERMETK